MKDLSRVLESTRKKQDSKALVNLHTGQGDLNSLIEDQFRRLHSSITLAYNKKYSQRGQLFLARHKHVAVELVRKLHYILPYIHHNPIHHDFVTQYDEWPYSSYREFFHPNGKYPELEFDHLGSVDDIRKLHEHFRLQARDS